MSRFVGSRTKNLITEFKTDIIEYCCLNNLDSNKLFRLPKSYNNRFVAVQYPKEMAKGILDETPSPVVLWIILDGDAVRFEQTKYTKQYLSYDNSSELEEKNRK